MGCNAWNHPSNCNCGWGGDTGGGGGSNFRALQVANGKIWSVDSRPNYDSFVVPNAICPVCGCEVFFYQSPFGGRVFFDSLGPPWPKHPCTDQSRSLNTNVRSIDRVYGIKRAPSTPAVRPLFKRSEWRPLEFESIEAADNYDAVKFQWRDRLPNGTVLFPKGVVGTSPAYWRWCESLLGHIEVSYISSKSDGQDVPRLIELPAFISDPNRRNEHAQNSELTAEELSAIGFSMSFAWRVKGLQELWKSHYPSVDFQAARQCFERASELGFWAAQNNLAVMYRDGLGVEVNNELAFELFTRAAESGQARALTNLAGMYEHGLGTAADPERANQLRASAELSKPA